MSTGHINITGKTKVLAILGDPVEHSLSPPMHNGEFDRLNLDYVYIPAGVKAEELEACVRGLAAAGVVGFNVTIPHKQNIMKYLTEISPEAQKIGAVNTVKIVDGVLHGYNTDAPGWVEDIQQDILLERNTLCMIGAGGAARAVAVGALLAGISRLFIVGRNLEKIKALAESLMLEFPEKEIAVRALDDPDAGNFVGESNILVNCTPVGMESNPGIPIPAEWLREHHYVYDTIYVPAETELMKATRQAGGAVRGGLGMLARQGALAFKIWTGIEPDVERMETTLRRTLS